MDKSVGTIVGTIAEEFIGESASGNGTSNKDAILLVAI